MKRNSLFALVLAFLFSTPLYSEDWPQFLGPRRDGTSLEKGLLDTFSRTGPNVRWKRDVGEGFSGPVIAGERLILFHRIGAEEVIECLQSDTAKILWKFTYATSYQDGLGKGDGPRSTPVIAGNRIITLGAEGTLHCLALQDGKKIWTHALTTEYRTPLGYFGVGSSPLVEQNLVLINVGGPKAGIVAFDLESGKEVWTATNDPPSYSSPVMASVGGTRLAVFFTRTGVVMLEPGTGTVRYQKRWRARYDASVNAATPLMVGDLAFFSTSYETGALLLKLRKDGADEVWADEEVMTNHYNTSVYHDGCLYGFHGRQEAGPSFRCVELKSKKVRWEQPRYGCGTTILAEGRLIVLKENGDLSFVQATPEAYRESAKVRLLDAGPCRAQIALANGRLYARDQRQLICVDLKK